MALRAALFDGYAFGQVARFIDIAPEFDCQMVGKKLKRDDS